MIVSMSCISIIIGGMYEYERFSFSVRRRDG